MGMSITLREFLDETGTPYDLLGHPHTITSMQTAAAAHVSGDLLAKSVVAEDDQGYMMVDESLLECDEVYFEAGDE